MAAGSAISAHVNGHGAANDYGVAGSWALVEYAPR
jgi:hypothetical protein